MISSEALGSQRLSLAGRLVAVALFAGLTALGARCTVRLPGNPVPLTLQVLPVLLSGLALGPVGGAGSQLLYLGAIASGLPVDARGLGPAALFGPTAGYLYGFVAAAALAGLGNRARRHRQVNGALAVLAGLVALYALGTAWLAIWGGLGFAQAVHLGVVPFVLADLAKAALAWAASEGWRALRTRVALLFG
jgi:biotin transport system substrate-specific component